MSISPRGVCPFCRRRYNLHTDARRTIDHIVPRSWSGNGRLWPDGPRNVRACCGRCNVRRGLAWHCVGLKACVEAVARDEHVPFRQVFRAWGIGRDPHRMTKEQARAIGLVFRVQYLTGGGSI